jgi:hypothetical protein
VFVAPAKHLGKLEELRNQCWGFQRESLTSSQAFVYGLGTHWVDDRRLEVDGVDGGSFVAARDSE